MPCFSNFKEVSVRESAILTDSYVAGTVIGPSEMTEKYDQLNVEVQFTKGSLTSAEVKLEFSHDGSTYFQETFQDISAGTSTDSLGEHSYSATGNYLIERPLKYRYVRISAKGTGTVTNSLMAIKVLLGVNLTQ